MRGLDIRVMLAQARITAFVDPALADGMYYNLMDEAFSQGIRDARDGNMQIPMLFRDEELLASCWHSGLQFEAERLEMSDCPVCGSDNGHCCAVHG